MFSTTTTTVAADGMLNLPSLPIAYRNRLSGMVDALMQVLVDGLHCQLQGCYGLGKTAEWLGRELCWRHYQRASSPASSFSSDPPMGADAAGGTSAVWGRNRKTVVLLVDRSMDLVAPLGHADHLLDMIYSVLPADTQDLLQPAISEEAGVAINLPLGGSGNRLALVVEQLIDAASVKDGLQVVRSALVEALAAPQVSNVVDKIPKSAQLGRVTANQLTRLLELLQTALTKSSIADSGEHHNYRPLIELTMACLRVLRDAPQHSWDELQGVEKIIQAQSMGEQDGGRIILSQLRSLLPSVTAASGSGAQLSSSSVRGFSLRAVMQLIAQTFSLCSGNRQCDLLNNENNDEELTLLREALLKCFMHYPRLSEEGLLLNTVATETTFSEADCSPLELKQQRLERERQVEDFFHLLCSIDDKRRQAPQLRICSDEEPYVPLVQSVAEQILRNQGRPPEPCKYFSPAQFRLGHQLLSGVSRILGGPNAGSTTSSSGNNTSTPPLPIDADGGLVVCVLGGVSFTEIRALRRLGRQFNRPIAVCSSHVASGGGVTFSRLLESVAADKN